MKIDGPKTDTSAAESIDAILRLEKKEERTLTIHHRFLHAIGGFVGTSQFILLQCGAAISWVAFNACFQQLAFDAYPFPLLATVLALEAVLLTSSVLIRQNLIDQTLERRDHLELQINLLAEREATRSLRILQAIAKRLDVGDIEDCKEDELAEETSVDQIAQDLKAREEAENRKAETV